MSTTCYAMVRGSAIRVTNLDRCGDVGDPVTYAVSKSVASVRINDVVESGVTDTLRTDEDEIRMRLVQSDTTIRYLVDVDFLRVDPGLLSIVTGVPMVTNDAGDVVGFDSVPRLPAKAFALEVWSRLADSSCTDGRKWGYTVFPFLKGGYVSGFTFANSRVSFNLRGAQSRKSDRWGVGPYDLEGPWRRLLTDVSRNTPWRTTVTTGAPPTEQPGIQTYEDVIYGGSAVTSDDVIDGNDGSPWIINGGRA